IGTHWCPHYTTQTPNVNVVRPQGLPTPFDHNHDEPPDTTHTPQQAADDEPRQHTIRFQISARRSTSSLLHSVFTLFRHRPAIRLPDSSR
ncbi:unnamed protein product, partial [Citrullus colocynthis]